MSLADKCSGFEHDDLLRFATGSGLKRPAARRVVDDVVATVTDWPCFAADADVPNEDIRRIARMHRLALGVRQTVPAVNAP